MMNKRRAAVFTLLLLAPVCGEVMSTSQPVLEFFQPLNIMLQASLYGCGALLVRELVRRWNQGWLSILLLGLAYGIYEEGIVVRSFFDPAWMDLGILAVYGRWLGVNWVWAVWLSIYHAVMSITVPIALVELLFPEQAGELWLGKKGMAVAGFFFLLVSGVGPLMGMQASVLAIAGSLAAMLLLGWMAYWMPGLISETDRMQKASSPGKIRLKGFLLMLGVMLDFMLLPSIAAPVPVTIAAGMALTALAVVAVVRSGGANWGRVHRHAAVFGVLLPWLLIDVIAELGNADRPDNTSGMILFALVAFLLMWILGRHLRKESCPPVTGGSEAGVLPAET